MAIQRVNITEFLALAQTHPVMDVRSPGEYQHAHIPGVHSLPLFADEERKVVGTAYKQESREKAIKIGLEYFGKKMVSLVESAETICATSKSKTVLVHCWRGGMRSAGVAWLLDLYGFKVYTLAGGYKVYRQWVLEQFTKPYNIQIIGGYTGSGKTVVLKALKAAGEGVVDLEAIAHHKGSAFGNIGLPPQPSPEMFENTLATELSRVSATHEMIWMEDESQRIGDVNLPGALFNHMRTKPVFFLDIPFEERLKHIVAEYGALEKERLVNAIMRIQKRLGGLETKNAVNFLIEGNVPDCFRILLRYYDKWYGKSLQNRDNWENLVQTIALPTCDASENAAALLKLSSKTIKEIHG